MEVVATTSIFVAGLQQKETVERNGTAVEYFRGLLRPENGGKIG